MSLTCNNCRYYSEVERGRGRCHGNPPTVVITRLSSGVHGPDYVRPVVSGGDLACRFHDSAADESEREPRRFRVVN